MDDSSAAIYSEAKSEYTKQLVFNFQPVLLRFFLDRFNEVKTSSSVATKTKSSLSEFQDSLSQIPEWNLDKVNSESSVLLKSMQCDYTEDLITAVFIAHTKILSAIRLHSKPRRKINITVPKPEHFMHRAISECSRLLWSNVYLFNDSASSIDKQKNMNEVNRFIEEGILQAIRNLLPVKSILRDSLQEDDDMIQVNMKDGEDKENIESKDEYEVKEPEPKDPEPKESEIKEPEQAISETKEPEQVVSEVNDPDIKQLVDIKEVPNTVNVVKEPETLVIDTERSVGFTGIDSIFGTTGEAELKPMIEEGDDELKIIGELEELNLEDIEDLDKPDSMSAPLAVGDYETL